MKWLKAFSQGRGNTTTMQPYTFKKGRRQCHLRSFVFIVLLLLASCTAGSYGRLLWSDEALDIFESASILADHTYYFFGPGAEPFAILALDNQYVLAPSLWKQIDITPAILNRWRDRIDNRHRFPQDKYHGAVIVNEQGNRLGIWYSDIHWTVIRKGEEKNEVVIYTPDTTHQFRDHRDRDHSSGTK